MKPPRWIGTLDALRATSLSAETTAQLRLIERGLSEGPTVVSALVGERTTRILSAEELEDLLFAAIEECIAMQLAQVVQDASEKG
jgi:hypothetical protein